MPWVRGQGVPLLLVLMLLLLHVFCLLQQEQQQYYAGLCCRPSLWRLCVLQSKCAVCYPQPACSGKDNGCGGTDRGFRGALALVAGRTYYIAVSPYRSGDRPALRLNVTAVPRPNAG